MNKIKIKALISLSLLIIFVIVLISGIALFLAPTGHIAKTEGWLFLWLTKWQWEKIHTLSGFIMSGIVVIHLLMNWRLFVGELRSLRRKN